MGSLLDDGLLLGLGFSATTTSKPKITKPSFKFDQILDHHEILSATSTLVEPSLSLSLSGDRYLHNPCNNNFSKKTEVVKKSGSVDDHQRQASSHSSVSSFSGGAGGGGVRVKRERDLSNCSEEIEVERGACNSRISDEDEKGSKTRKKLRLTKDQSALLEESFKLHSTLNPKKKQDLARRLILSPRQVEVWFQNRRARTKLKQTEVESELLKKCCETLTAENRRLQKELQELKAMKLAQPPFYMQIPAATLSMCPSCERNNGVVSTGCTATTTTTTSKTASLISLASKTHTFYNNPFTNSPAAC